MRPGPEHERLNAFVGTWKTEGETRASPLGPAARITAVDTYEWFPGGFFLVHHVDARVGDEEIKVIEIIGHDASNGRYFTRSFDSQGNAGTYEVSVRDGRWTFTGKSERATVQVSADGKTMTANWERSEDGSTWLPWMDVKLTRNVRDVRSVLGVPGDGR
jgi:VCBS repeat-containing protein